MPKSIPADRIIGIELIAARTLPKLNWSQKKIGEFKAGESVGRVRTYVQLGTPFVFWVFGPGAGTYLIKHEDGAFKREGELKRVLDKWEREQKAEIEKEKIENKGTIPYYIEKYGVWILGFIGATILLKAYINKRG